CAALSGLAALSFLAVLAQRTGLAGDLFLLPALGLFGWWVLWIGYLMLATWREVSACWLVGPDGLAHWDGTRAVAIRGDDIGTVWRVVFLAEDDPAQTGFRASLVFTSADGTEL